MLLKRIIFLIPLLIIFTTQKSLCHEVDSIKPSFQLKNEDGIYIEQFDLSNLNDNRFTEDNLVYTAGRVFTYDYSYYSKGKKYYFQASDNTQSTVGAWELVPAKKKNSNTITRIKMIVKPGLQGFEKLSKDYSQTVVQYKFLKDTIESSFSEHTGVIENGKNIWMHPPRTMLFRVLELNPFPFILRDKTPIWKWNLMIGSHWSDTRWKKWEGSVENKMSYLNKGNEHVKTPFGNIKCNKIIAEGKLPWGITRLVSYFHEKYGFVKLIYTNIDGSILQFDLKSISP